MAQGKQLKFERNLCNRSRNYPCHRWTADWRTDEFRLHELCWHSQAELKNQPYRKRETDMFGGCTWLAWQVAAAKIRNLPALNAAHKCHFHSLHCPISTDILFTLEVAACACSGDQIHFIFVWVHRLGQSKSVSVSHPKPIIYHVLFRAVVTVMAN